MPFAKEDWKYDVATLAKELGIQEASVRVALRNRGIPKAGKSYGWNKEADYKDVVKKLRESNTAEKPKAGKAAPAKADKAAPAKTSAKPDAKASKGGDKKPKK